MPANLDPGDAPSSQAASDRELVCGACGYALHTSKCTGRCPECGSAMVNSLATQSTLPKHAQLTTRARCAAWLLFAALLLLGVVLFFNTTFGGDYESPFRRTRTTMMALLNIAVEHHYLTGEAFHPTNASTAMQEFIAEVKKNPDIAKMLDALGPEVYDSATNSICDGWGNPIRYYIDTSHDDDRPSDEFFRAREGYFFVSAGRDEAWGDVRAAKTTDEFKRTRDNLYSFDIQ